MKITTLEFHPLSADYPLMSEEDLQTLADDIRENGYDANFPVIIYDGKILAGRDRVRACRIVGVEPAFAVLSEDANPHMVVIRENEQRKHFLPHFLHARKKKRILRAVEMRAQGKTFRCIASELGISTAQVRRDLETAGPKKSADPGEDSSPEENSSGEANPEAPSNFPEKEIDPETPKDEFGRELTGGLAEAWEEPKRERLLSLLRQIQKAVSDYASHPGGREFASTTCQIKGNNYIVDAIDILAARVKQTAPYCAYCPSCEGGGKQCNLCSGKGWISKAQYQTLSPEQKAKCFLF